MDVELPILSMTERMNKKCTNEKILPGIFLFEMTFEQINLHDDPSYQNAEKNVANNDSQIEKL